MDEVGKMGRVARLSVDERTWEELSEILDMFDAIDNSPSVPPRPIKAGELRDDNPESTDSDCEEKAPRTVMG